MHNENKPGKPRKQQSFMTEKLHSEKERLLDSALALYSKYGFKSVTIEDISRQLGISKKTIYQLVSDKNELIREVLDYEQRIQATQMELLSRSDLNAIDELLGLNSQLHQGHRMHSPAFFFDLKKYYPVLFGHWMEERRRRSHEMILRNLKKGIREGLYREDLNVEIISSLQQICAEALHTISHYSSDAPGAPDFIDEIFAYHIYGICNERGVVYFKNRDKKLNNKK